MGDVDTAAVQSSSSVVEEGAPVSAEATEAPVEKPARKGKRSVEAPAEVTEAPVESVQEQPVEEAPKPAVTAYRLTEGTYMYCRAGALQPGDTIGVDLLDPESIQAHLDSGRLVAVTE